MVISLGVPIFRVFTVTSRKVVIMVKVSISQSSEIASQSIS